MSKLNLQFYDFFELQNGGKLRLVDYYIQFQEFIKDQLDILNGKSIQEISSWFFEQTASGFLQDQHKVEHLTHLYHSFQAEVTS